MNNNTTTTIYVKPIYIHGKDSLLITTYVVHQNGIFSCFLPMQSPYKRTPKIIPILIFSVYLIRLERKWLFHNELAASYFFFYTEVFWFQVFPFNLLMIWSAATNFDIPILSLSFKFQVRLTKKRCVIINYTVWFIVLIDTLNNTNIWIGVSFPIETQIRINIKYAIILVDIWWWPGESDKLGGRFETTSQYALG